MEETQSSGTHMPLNSNVQPVGVESSHRLLTGARAHPGRRKGSEPSAQNSAKCKELKEKKDLETSKRSRRGAQVSLPLRRRSSAPRRFGPAGNSKVRSGRLQPVRRGILQTSAAFNPPGSSFNKFIPLLIQKRLSERRRRPPASSSSSTSSGEIMRSSCCFGLRFPLSSFPGTSRSLAASAAEGGSG